MSPNEREFALTNPEKQIRSYVLGHAGPEKERLLIQAQLYDPYTEAFLRKAGIREGMKVLDVGSGIGNLSLLAAKLVGASGQIIGADANVEVSHFATMRAQELGHKNIEFFIGDLLSVDFEDDFDAIIGRLILPHVKHPALLLKRLVSNLRPGGIVAFEEIASAGTAIPGCPQIETIYDLYRHFFERLEIDPNFGYRVPRLFQAAGLGVPSIDYFAPAGSGPHWLGYKWLAEGVRAHLPTLRQLNLASGVERDIDTLEVRIREEAVTNQSTVTLLPHIGAWSTIP